MRACMRLLCVPQVRTAAVLSACLKYRCESADPGVRNAASGNLVMRTVHHNSSAARIASANTGPASHLPTLCQSSCFSWESCNYRGRHTDCARCAPASVCGALTARSLPPSPLRGGNARPLQRGEQGVHVGGGEVRRQRVQHGATQRALSARSDGARLPGARAARARPSRTALRWTGAAERAARCLSAPRWRKRRLAAVAAVGRCESVMPIVWQRPRRKIFSRTTLNL